MRIPPQCFTTPVSPSTAQVSDLQASAHIGIDHGQASRSSGASRPSHDRVVDHRPHVPSHGNSSQARTMLNSVLMGLGRGAENAETSGSDLRQEARANLDKIADDRLQIAESREIPKWNKFLIQKNRLELDQARKFADFYHPLFARITTFESSMDLLAQLARENQTLQLLSYHADVKRDPFDMVTTPQGDCETFSTVFEMLAQAAGSHDLARHEFSTPMSFSVADIPGASVRQATDTVDFMRHTILSCRDNEGRLAHFDPVFGRQVNPDFYGKDVDRYLMRNPRAA